MSSPAPAAESAHNPPAVLEVDDSELVGDETYATDDESAYTSSVTSSVRAYRQENGHTYHAYKDGRAIFSPMTRLRMIDLTSSTRCIYVR